MSAVVIFVWAVFNWPNSKGTILCADGNVSRRHKFTCDVRRPNITGSAKMDKNASGLPVIFDGSGALSVSTRTISENVAYYNTSGVTPVEGVLSFSARSSNSIYSGSTVQPSAIRLMLCIKI